MYEWTCSFYDDFFNLINVEAIFHVKTVMNQVHFQGNL